MRPAEPIDEPDEPIHACAAARRIRACAAATPVPKLDPPHQCMIYRHQAGSVTPVPNPTPKGGERGHRPRRRNWIVLVLI